MTSLTLRLPDEMETPKRLSVNGAVTVALTVPPAIPAHWCDRDSSLTITVNSKQVTEKSQCVHKADVTAESPLIYSDDTVENIASAGAFYNKTAAGDLSTIFARSEEQRLNSSHSS